MAYEDDDSHSRRRQRRSIGSDDGRHRGNRDMARPTLEEMREIRNELYTNGVRRRAGSITRMPSTTSRTTSAPKSSSRHRHGSHRSDTERLRHRRRATETNIADYVYAPREGRQRRRESEEEDDDLSMIAEEPKAKEKKIRVVYVNEERPRRHISRDDERYESRASSQLPQRTSSRRSPSSQPLDILKRTLSTRDVHKDRPLLRRSHTSSSAHTSKAYGTSVTANPAPLIRRSTFMGLFAPTPAPPRTPPRVVQCLTCMDDIPHAKSARLKCGHRMCHACLKRIFKMSVNDPQHMPPKCCTSEHIPLKHVERLFDTSFKILWNKKFQEYTTKNRMYCPARRCGEWIKPGNIYVEGGKRYGKCSRCKTKVCGRCNGKWHGSKDCPKDDATNALLEAAKKAGWQRCFNCRSMVELKEGCNHMTCRCTAEFCMICGLKWKTCDCPWFNYEAVETNRLHHMRIPGRPRARHDDDDDDDDDEPHARQRHDPVDDDLARRLHAVQVREDDEVEVEVEDYHGRNGPPNTHHHHVYRRPVPLAHAAANYAVRVDPARLPPARRSPPPVARRPPPSRISETPILRRPAPPPTPALRPSVLAGLEGPRRGGRVSAWRAYVTPTAPAEGVLSM